MMFVASVERGEICMTLVLIVKDPILYGLSNREVKSAL